MALKPVTIDQNTLGILDGCPEWSWWKSTLLTSTWSGRDSGRLDMKHRRAVSGGNTDRLQCLSSVASLNHYFFQLIIWPCHEVVDGCFVLSFFLFFSW